MRIRVITISKKTLLHKDTEKHHKIWTILKNNISITCHKSWQTITFILRISHKPKIHLKTKTLSTNIKWVLLCKQTISFILCRSVFISKCRGRMEGSKQWQQRILNLIFNNKYTKSKAILLINKRSNYKINLTHVTNQINCNKTN